MTMTVPSSSCNRNLSNIGNFLKLQGRQEIKHKRENTRVHIGLCFKMRRTAFYAMNAAIAGSDPTNGVDMLAGFYVVLGS
jgi:hypothetical protein